MLEPEIFYLLLSAEGACIPPGYAAEMTAYDPTAGELRTHYAGFFDPGFGYDPRGRRHGTRAALEVRARDVSFMVEHRQPICKLAFERMLEPPDVLYGEDARLELPGPGDDAQQALRRADGGRPAPLAVRPSSQDERHPDCRVGFAVVGYGDIVRERQRRSDRGLWKRCGVSSGKAA